MQNVVRENFFQLIAVAFQLNPPYEHMKRVLCNAFLFYIRYAFAWFTHWNDKRRGEKKNYVKSNNDSATELVKEEDHKQTPIPNEEQEQEHAIFNCNMGKNIFKCSYKNLIDFTSPATAEV